MATPIEQIKERLDIVEVISPYVKLTRAGKNYKGLSPFNKEKTPSFFVSPERGMYYCFSSNRGGDMFTFIQEMEGLDFQGALKLLANKAGVELVHESKENRDVKERLFEVIEEAAIFFEKKLAQQDHIREYISGRGVTDETLRAWRIGFAPDAWEETKEYLTSKGYSEKELLDAGLVKKSDDGARTYDRFRNRVMFPLFDTSGRVIAFSGRIAPGGDEKAAKYLNSPETVLFDKSRVLYGYDKARLAIRKFNFAILVEGQMDLVLSHQAGYPNTVATSGTAFTEHHLRLILRFTKNLLAAFDADRAGLASSARAAKLALRLGMDVKIPKMPAGMDPAELIKGGKEKWKEAIRNAEHVIDFYLRLIAQSEPDTRKMKLRVREGILPFVALIDNKIDQAHFVTKIANFIEVPESALYEELAKIDKGDPLLTPKETEPVKEEKKNLSRKEYIEAMAIGLVLWKEEEEDVSKYREKVEAALGKKIENGDLQETDKARYIFQAEAAFGGIKEEEQIEDFITELHKEYTKEEQLKLSKKIKDAETKGDAEEVEKLLAEYTALTKKDGR